MVVTLEYRVIPASSLNHPVQRLGVSAGCGGRLTAPYGALHSRNYPQNYGPEDDCVWSIEVAEGHAVELELQDLDIYASLAERRSGNCSGSFLQVIDGADLEGRELLRTCGGGLPDNRTLTSTANKMTVRMKSDGARSSKGFRATYATVCGSTIVTASSGVITSHDAINVQGKNANCSWTVIAEDPADHVTLTIGTLTVSHLDFSEGEEDCSSNNNVEVWEGVDSTGVLLGRYCTGRVPPALTSRGSALHIVMVSPFNSFHGWFSASYSVLSSACGGTFSAERGSFASPGYPASYPPGSDCVWTVTSAPGNLVQMSFSLFNLESSWGCFDDFVEVRKESAMGPLVGVYCGDERPSNLTAAHTLWVKFRSNAQGTAPGFLADFALVHGNLDITGRSGEIASPLYPSLYAQSGDFEWRVTVDTKKAVILDVKSLSTDRFGVDDCDDVYLAIHDGFDATTPQLYKDCGAALPRAVTTTSNVAFVRLHNYPIRRATTFLLAWREVDRPDGSATTVEAGANNCSSTIHLPAGGSVNVSSPGYPGGYGSNENCTWVLDTDPGWHLAVLFRDMDLEDTAECYSDRVEVASGERGGLEWKTRFKLCQPSAMFNDSFFTTNFMRLNFVSDWGTNGTGFAGTVYSGKQSFSPNK
ncbi:cubilin-like isoform X2 [Frankliniella occidentalis]|uniref:Cubilin-like isoform X2 n=1 Tax=Frankliniella occidentalis TaxID=133901 RepID=A0A9C6X7C2_FRAOC|nr:cubilin-like isoform X2 [Frankliniella occidentalis]